MILQACFFPIPSSHYFLYVENPDNDPHRGGEAEDPGGSVGKPWYSPGQCWTVPSHPLLHHRAVCSPAAVGIQDGLRAYWEGQTHYYPSNFRYESLYLPKCWTYSLNSMLQVLQIIAVNILFFIAYSSSLPNSGTYILHNVAYINCWHFWLRFSCVMLVAFNHYLQMRSRLQSSSKPPVFVISDSYQFAELYMKPQKFYQTFLHML